MTQPAQTHDKKSCANRVESCWWWAQPAQQQSWATWGSPTHSTPACMFLRCASRLSELCYSSRKPSGLKRCACAAGQIAVLTVWHVRLTNIRAPAYPGACTKSHGTRSFAMIRQTAHAYLSTDLPLLLALHRWIWRWPTSWKLSCPSSAS